MPSPAKFQDASLVLLRLIVAAIFLYACYGKLMFWSPLPAEMSFMPAWMIPLMKFLSIVEPLGAIALIVGFLTRWAAAGLAIIMVGSLFVLKLMMQAHFFTSPAGTGMDFNTLILAGCLMLVTFGGGKWTLDRLWRKA